MLPNAGVIESTTKKKHKYGIILRVRGIILEGLYLGKTEGNKLPKNKQNLHFAVRRGLHAYVW